jgi:hypothetical protein
MDPGNYNCFAYAEAFITGAFPPWISSDSTIMYANWLKTNGFSRMGLNPNLIGLPRARLGDLVIAEDPTDQTGGIWDHIGIVIGVDRNDRITRIRQKYGPRRQDCVIDTTAAQFGHIARLNFELWRNGKLDFLGTKLAQ